MDFSLYEYMQFLYSILFCLFDFVQLQYRSLKRRLLNDRFQLNNGDTWRSIGMSITALSISAKSNKSGRTNHSGNK